MLFAGRQVRIGKNCARGLSTTRGRRPRADAQDRGHSCSHTADLGRQITCLFISVGNYFIRNICVDFLLKQFHTVRVRLTFLEVCFLRLDNKIHFRYDSCHYPNP